MLEQQIASDATLSDDMRSRVVEEFNRRESEFTRLQRQRMSAADFEPLTIIGRGAFGEVWDMLH
jgi:serine/threonine kinase 38